MRHTSFLALSAMALAACGPVGGNQDAGRDIQRLEGGNNAIALQPSFAFEGQRRFVGVIGPGRDDMTNATVSAPPGSGIVLESVQCNRLRCAFVGHIDDVLPNAGSPIPEPASSRQFTISVVSSEYNYSAPVNVFPLDTADGAALGAGQITTDAVYSTLVIESGSILRAVMELPVRFAVLNTAEVHGTFDFSAMGATPGPGGAAGGEPPAGDGQGRFPGLGSMNGGGGGGGNGEAGRDGTGPSGTMGGAGGSRADDALLARFGGGSGGGAGPTGAGGGGGGAFAFTVFGSANFDGARFLFRGGDGQGEGGGGAGGTLLLGGNPTGSFTVDLAGGRGATSGELRGGDGGGGRLRLDGEATGVMVMGGVLTTGVRFDLSAMPPLVRDPHLTIRGFAAPGTRVRVKNEVGGTTRLVGETTTGPDGRWSIDYMMPIGFSSFVAYGVTGVVEVPSMSGTTVIVRGDATRRQVYSGAVDVVYLPASE